nr:unnamed protein product [Callosobruchus chinensis]
MSSPAPKSPEQNDKSKKYDRQLRLWGDHGQKLLENSKVCLINATALGTEILKSLVLPGIGSFTIVDGEKIAEEDIGSNFFLENDSVGLSRAQVTTQCLLELNPDVRGDYIDESAEHILVNTQDFFKNFSVVIATALSENSEAKLVSLTTDDKSGVSVLSLQRPPVNSLNLELLRDIQTALTEAEKNKSRGVILTSQKDGVFSAGLDIMEMYKPNQDRLKEFWTTLQDCWIKLYGCSYPTVAVINGHSPAGGCLLAMSCEYRIMQTNCTIGLNETLLGIVAPLWFISTMKNVIGHRQSELALTQGKMFTTDDALKVELIDETMNSKDEGMEKAKAFLAKFAKIPPMARSITKQYIRGPTIQEMVKNKQVDLDNFLQFTNNPQVQQSLGMYLEMLKKKGGKVVIPLSKHLWECNVPLVVCRSIGFIGYIQLQVKEHTVIETHPDNQNPDLRLDSPWPALQEYLDSIDVEALDTKARSHTPAVVILYYYLKKYQEKHNSFPKTRQEKEVLKKMIRDCPVGPDGPAAILEANFEEALHLVNTCVCKTTVPSHVREILDDKRKCGEAVETAKHVIFDCPALCRRRSSYLEVVQEEGRQAEGTLPVRGSLPDMTADTATYVTLQQIYQKQALAQAEAIHRRASQIARGLGMGPEAITESEAIAAYYPVLRALERFAGECDAPPGRRDERIEPDAADMKTAVARLLTEWNVHSPQAVADERVHEVCRYGGAELHSVSATLGGCAAHEVIKLITHQYKPLNNAFFYDAITCSSTTLCL